MAEYKSEYYAEKERNYRKELHGLQRELPRYMMPYLQDLELSHQVRTSIAYTRELISFLRFIKDQNPLYQGMPLAQIPYECMENLTYLDINEYQSYLSYSDGEGGHSCGDHAINRAMCALRGFFRYEVIHEHLVKDPTLGASKGKRIKNKPIERLTAAGAHQLLQGVEASQSGTEHSRCFTVKTQLRDTAIFTLLLGTGIRVSEIVGLDMKDIDFERQSIRIVRKGGDIDDVYFNENVAAALKDYIELERGNYLPDPDEPALFLSNKRCRMTTRGMQKLVEKYGKSTLGNQSLHPHTLRKTFGTRLYEATGDIAIVADTLGHSSINTTRKHYADVSDQHKARVREIDLYD